MAIDLRSDTMTRPTPAMRRAMAEAEVGDDLWREDPTTRRLEAAVAERLGHQAALFVPSGTMGNQICLRLSTPPGTECLLSEDNHVLWHEAGAGARLSGIQFHAIQGERGLLDPEALRARVRTEEYGAPTSTIAVEQTHNRGGGAVWPLETLEAVRAVADDGGLHLHCDGARIWNAHVASGVALDRYGALFDSLSVCFSKGLAAPVGSAVVGSRELVERARQERQLLGGGMRQSGVLAAAALVALERMVDRLTEDHANARRTAETIAAAVPGSVDLAQVQTNMVMLSAAAFGTDGPGLVKRLADLDVLAGDNGPGVVRLVFHYEVSERDADRAAGAIVAAGSA
jgi:threonine aldolase